MRSWWPFVLVACLLGPAAVLAEEDQPAVAVMEFASKGGVTQEQMDALGELLANEIRDLGAFRVIGKSDIQAVLQFEEKKILAGCSDDSCIAEIGGALGAQFVAVGSVSLFGETYLLNLKLLDVRKISVWKGISRKVKGGEDALLDATSSAVREIFVPLKEALARTAARPADPPPDPPADPPAEGGAVAVDRPPPPADPTPPAGSTEAEAPPRSTQRLWAHITLWSGVGLTVLGGVAGVLGYLEGQAYRDGEPDALAPARGYAAAMWVGLGLGVALVATGTTLWLLEPEGPALTSAGLGPTPDGQGFQIGLGGRW
jgi:TolB-like protein